MHNEHLPYDPYDFQIPLRQLEEEITALLEATQHLVDHAPAAQLRQYPSRQDNAIAAAEMNSQPDTTAGSAHEHGTPGSRPSHELPKGELYSMDYPRFKAWAMLKLNGLIGLVERSITNPQEIDITDALNRSTAWTNAYNDQYWHETDCDPDFARVAAKCQASVRPIIDSPALSTAAKADLIEAAASTYRGDIDGNSAVEREMAAELREGRTDLCAQLLTRRSSGQWAANAVSSALAYADGPELTHLVGGLLLPMAERLRQQYNARGLHGAEDGITALNYALSRLEAQVESSGDTQPAETVGPQLLGAANIIAGAFTGRAPYIEGQDWPSSSIVTASRTIDLLRMLYLSKYSGHGQLPTELEAFFKTLTDEASEL